MAVKKAQANYDNGVSYDVLHYETQASQVKVFDASGSEVSSLEELFLEGKLVESESLNDLLLTGKYRVKNMTGAPSGVSSTETYLVKVESIEVGAATITHQEFVDHSQLESYYRTINGSIVGEWVKLGKSMADKVKQIGDLSALQTSYKGSIVGAINEVNDGVKQSIDEGQMLLSAKITEVERELELHHHDDRYLTKTGGSMTGSVAMANNKPYQAKNTSGVGLDVAKVNGVNELILGSSQADTVISSKTADIYISSGANKFKLLHTGNTGAGSGIDADSLDGIHGSEFAKKTEENHFQQDQYVAEGKSLIIKAAAGSNQAGSVYFKDGNDIQRGKIAAYGAGDVKIFAGSIAGHTFKSTGEIESEYSHIFDVSARETKVAWRNGVSDKGAGFYMNNNTNRVGLWDWNKEKPFFTTDRDDMSMNIANLKVQGRRLSIQTTAPTSPEVNDVWIDI